MERVSDVLRSRDARDLPRENGRAANQNHQRRPRAVDSIDSGSCSGCWESCVSCITECFTHLCALLISLFVSPRNERREPARGFDLAGVAAAADADDELPADFGRADEFDADGVPLARDHYQNQLLRPDAVALSDDPEIAALQRLSLAQLQSQALSGLPQFEAETELVQQMSLQDSQVVQTEVARLTHFLETWSKNQLPNDQWLNSIKGLPEGAQQAIRILLLTQQPYKDEVYAFRSQRPGATSMQQDFEYVVQRHPKDPGILDALRQYLATRLG
jgi:hypothetical protein